MRIITVSREFGSGGREVGKRLADALGIAYYDREILEEVAKRSNLDEGYIEKTLEGGVRMQYPITFSHSFSYIPLQQNPAQNILAQQHKVLLSLAERGDCVIVGRSADVILEQYQPMRLFVYADMDAKMQRCRERAPVGESYTDKELRRRIRQIDKARAANHDFVSAFPWGDRRGYDLCINTTDCSIKHLIPGLAAYIGAWFAEREGTTHAE